MEPSNFEADIFAFPDVSPRCQWLMNHEDTTKSLLFPLAAISDDDFNASFLMPSASKQHAFFQLPPSLAVDQLPPPQPSPDHHDPTIDCVTDTESADDDIWPVLEDSPARQAGLKTWKAFEAGESQCDALPTPMLLSEAGPAVFDVLIKLMDERIASGGPDVVTIETQTYISSLLAAALGRSSLLFRKDEATMAFHSALGMLRIEGCSRQALQGMESEILFCGSTLMQLAAFVRRTYTIKSSPCQVALASGIDQVLRAADVRAAIDSRNFRSILQLRSFVTRLSTLLTPLHDLASKLPPQPSDKDVLDLVFSVASSQDDSQDSVQQMMREVLQRSSAPWIEFLEGWIGTRRELGAPLTRLCGQGGRCFIKIDKDMDMDHFGHEQEKVEFCLDPSNIPDFIPNDVMDLILEAGRNLRFLGEFHPKHLLVQQPLLRLPKVRWLFDWESMLDFEKQLEQYRHDIRLALQLASDNILSDLQTAVPAETSNAGWNWDDLMGQISASMEQFSEPLPSLQVEDSLGRLVFDQLGDGRYTDVHEEAHVAEANISKAHVEPHWSLLPTVSFANIAATQARIYGRESLRLLFDAHNLWMHLKMLRDFHLLGNGFFCSRLSHALFDSSLESSQRKAGAARTGGVMGLGLGGRDTWPPASSELRLALMSVLTESYDDARAASRANRSRHDSGTASTTGLPGDVSFAIRDLTPEQIEKVMDPDGIEALDFLGLSYRPPQEIASVITRQSLVCHDDIFKMLLRVLRILYVVDGQCRNVCLEGTARRYDKISFRFVREAQHFIKTLASHFMDVGVAIPWQHFESKVRRVRAELDSGQPTHGSSIGVKSPEGIAQLHQEVLERISSALLLKERQQPVLELIEDMFGLILRHDKLLKLWDSEPIYRDAQCVEATRLYSAFLNKMKTFVATCRVMAQTGSDVDDSPGELAYGQDRLIMQLLVRLDFDSYYGERMD